ncbi:coiled coil-containing protein [Cryptosporidium canis]|nr:coiled coil-containing protein [Cryptosporidium canis]
MNNEARRFVSSYLRGGSGFYQFQVVRAQHSSGGDGGSGSELAEARNKVRGRYQLLLRSRGLDRADPGLVVSGEERLAVILRTLGLALAEDGTVKVPSGQLAARVEQDSRTLGSGVVAGDAGRLEGLAGRIKQELKRFDSDFSSVHGRVPSRADKEPLKPLYRLYRSLRDSGSASARERPRPEVESEIERLRQQKTRLRALLERYQDQFLRENHRKVLYHKDLLPIETEYSEYKSVKNKIKQLEELYPSQR